MKRVSEGNGCRRMDREGKGGTGMKRELEEGRRKEKNGEGGINRGWVRCIILEIRKEMMMVREDGRRMEEDEEGGRKM